MLACPGMGEPVLVKHHYLPVCKVGALPSPPAAQLYCPYNSEAGPTASPVLQMGERSLGGEDRWVLSWPGHSRASGPAGSPWGWSHSRAALSLPSPLERPVAPGSPSPSASLLHNFSLSPSSCPPGPHSEVLRGREPGWGAGDIVQPIGLCDKKTHPKTR